MSQPFADFYRGKRVLVTGHTGFEGGWTAAWLKVMGAQVCGYGLPPSTRPNFFDATILDRGMTSVFGDIRDRNSLASTFTGECAGQRVTVANIAKDRRHTAIENGGVEEIGPGRGRQSVPADLRAHHF